MYGLCDCNNFFASCERLFRPELNGRAVVVLSNNDGCVIARSNEAKALGIRMAQPYFQLRELAERHKVAIFSTNLTLYGDISRRVMTTLREMVPAAEVYSIDEAFLDLRGVEIDTLTNFGQHLSRTVQRNTGIPVSIGMAPTKTLAKIASKLCKQYPKLKGACLMHREQDIEKVLRAFEIGDVWGIGRKHTAMLQREGIRTAWDFRQRPQVWVRSKMGVVGVRIWRELRGEACIDFESAPPAKQQISVSRSFAHELSQFDDLHTAVANFAASCAEKLRSQNSLCAQVSVYILTNRHRDDLPQYYHSATIHPEVATSDTLEIIPLAIEGLKQIFKQGYGYKKAGVVLSDISSCEGVQANLFDRVDRPRHAQLMKVLDAANQAHGRHSVMIASQGFDPLKSNRDHLSKNYTTEWADIITVKV